MSNHEPRLTGEKVCPRCKRSLPVICFACDHRNKDGLCCYCRECISKNPPSRSELERRIQRARFNDQIINKPIDGLE